MDVRRIDKECATDGYCSGFKHCKDIKCDSNCIMCSECMEDHRKVMKEMLHWSYEIKLPIIKTIKPRYIVGDLRLYDIKTRF